MPAKAGSSAIFDRFSAQSAGTALHRWLQLPPYYPADRDDQRALHWGLGIDSSDKEAKDG
jgi:hypothetical protein